MTDLVRAALSAHYGLDCPDLVPLTGGYIHQVWRAGDRVVKRYRGRDWAPATVAPTLERQAFAAAAGHPVPAVFRTRSGDWLAPAGDGWLAVTTFAPGARLDDPTRITPAIAAEMGCTLKGLHRTLAALPVGAPPAPPSAGLIRRQALELGQLANAGKQAELDHLAATAARFRLELLERYAPDPASYQAQPFQTVHGDYYPGNLLFQPDGTVSAVLDWDFSGPRLKGMEVARAAVESARTPDGGLDQTKVTAFLQGYGEADPGCFRLWFDYLLTSLYPLPQAYQPGAALPEGWADLARRRHAMLLLLDRYLPDLEQWANSPLPPASH